MGDFCKKPGGCRKYIFDGDRCTCQAFEVHGPEEDEVRTIWDTSPYAAALQFAELYNEDGDYPMMDGEPIVVVIKGVRFQITAEPSINYYCKELADGDGTGAP